MRLRVVSENIANADTPGYRRKTVSFEEELRTGAPDGALRTGPIRLDRSELPEIYDPSNPLADASGNYRDRT